MVTALIQANAHAKSSDPGEAFRQCQQSAKSTHTSAAVKGVARNDGKNNCNTDGSAP
jgi:hypothetical protein